MTGSASDPLDWQPHIREQGPQGGARPAVPRPRRSAAYRAGAGHVALTGFDAPSLHTMYVDKPMRGHGLMQAIARVNRVFKDKPGGLVVDYLGLAQDLKRALAAYTESGGTGRTALDQDEAVAVMAGEVRGVPRPLPRLRLDTMDDGLSAGAADTAARRAGTHPRPGGRQGALLESCAGAVTGVRAGRASRGNAADQGRRGLLPNCAREAAEAGGGRRAPRGGARPCRPPDHLTGGGRPRG